VQGPPASRGESDRHAETSWKSGVSGLWSTASDWSTGTVPTARDVVTIDAAGTYTVTDNWASAASLLTLDAPGATFDDDSLVTLGSLALEAGSFALQTGGALAGATITADGGTFAADGGTVDGVTHEGTLDMSGANARLTIENGISLTGLDGVGAGTIKLNGSGASLTVDGATTLDNATIDIGYSTGDALVAGPAGATGSVLTLGSNVLIEQFCIYAGLEDAGLAGDGIVKQGSIDADVLGGHFGVGGYSFSNAGSITVGNGDTLVIQST
jgi:hypothetical protein